MFKLCHWQLHLRCDRNEKSISTSTKAAWITGSTWIPLGSELSGTSKKTECTSDHSNNKKNLWPHEETSYFVFPRHILLHSICCVSNKNKGTKLILQCLGLVKNKVWGKKESFEFWFWYLIIKSDSIGNWEYFKNLSCHIETCDFIRRFIIAPVVSSHPLLFYDKWRYA